VTRLRSLSTGASFGVAGPQDPPLTHARSGAARPWLWAVILALLFFALHLPYLPASLEDLDSINFALGVRQFDVAHHQPHPPGYPVFILVAKAVRAVVPSETTALALVSAGSGALGVLAIAWLLRRIDGPATPVSWSLAGVLVSITTPLYWFTAARPLSDSSGLAAALAVQGMTLIAADPSALALAAFSAGLASGIRSQVAWLTLPLLLFQGLRARGSRVPPRRSGPEIEGPGLEQASSSVPRERRASALSAQPLALLFVLFIAGVLVWFIPLVSVSGGPAAYWHALFDQGSEDLGNIQMLWRNHGRRDVVDALYYAFVAPWAIWPVAAIVLTSACAGIVRLANRHRPALIVLAVAFFPYLAFDLLFQETFTGRYALPLVVPIAYLAVSGLRALPWDTGLAVAVALAMFCAHIGGTSIAAYARSPAPAFRLLDAMRSAQRDGAAPVLAMDRRESLDMRRPMTWIGDAMPITSGTLPAPPQHEWLEAVKYWNSGQGAPVWFVVDPLRTAIDLVQHGDPVRFRWSLPYPILLSGARPNEMDWYRVDRPDWYVGQGWALTPETAGVADVDRKGPSLAPIDGWVSRAALGGALMIGGRSFDPDAHPRLTVRVGERVVSIIALAPGAFLDFVSIPADLIEADLRPYTRLTVEASAGSRVAIEQFDASAVRPIVGFGDGWQEQEFNPATGLRWRWLSERGELLAHMPFKELPPDRRGYRAATLHLEGESPLTYFSRGSTLTIRIGPRVVASRLLNADFTIDVPIGDPLETAPIVLETDQVFSPADRGWRRSADRRHLGLRIFKAEIRTARHPPAS
jgi:hypothetical protein